MRTVVAHVGQSAIGGLGCSRASCPLQQRPRLNGRRLRAWWRRRGRWSPVARSTRASFVHPALGWRGVRCHRRRRLRTRQRARRSGAWIAHGARWRTPTSSWVHGGHEGAPSLMCVCGRTRADGHGRRGRQASAACAFSSSGPKIAAFSSSVRLKGEKQSSSSSEVPWPSPDATALMSAPARRRPPGVQGGGEK